MKITLIGTTAASVTGFRIDLIKSLVAQNHQVFALATDYTDEQRRMVQAARAQPVDYDFNRTGLNPFGDIKDTLALSRVLKKIQPDLVFSYFAKPVIFGTLAARLAKVPRRIAMLEGLGFTFTQQPNGLAFKTKLIRWVQVLLYRIAFPFLEQIIFLNPDDPIDLIKKYNLKVKKINVLGGIGLNLDEYPFSVPDTQPVRFIFIGRLLAEKGINEYIAAAKMVKQRFKTAEFVVLGGLDLGNPGGITQAHLDSLIKQNIITYPGHVSNVNQWITAASVFVLPSYREGVPRSTQEAMAIGRAVITTDVPGCRQTVVNGVNGFLIPPWKPEVLAQKMIYFIENPSEIINMGLKGHQMAVEQFDAHTVNLRLVKMLLKEDNVK